jgi:hypothetical protein
MFNQLIPREMDMTMKLFCFNKKQTRFKTQTIYKINDKRRVENYISFLIVLLLPDQPKHFAEIISAFC